MGRRSYRVTAVGYTQAEALNAAIAADIEENGTHEGNNIVPAQAVGAYFNNKQEIVLWLRG